MTAAAFTGIFRRMAIYVIGPPRDRPIMKRLAHVDVPEVARQRDQIHDVVNVTAAPLVDALAPAAAAVVGREHDEPFLRPEVEA